MRRRSLFLGLVLAGSLIAPGALAGAAPEDAALADALYAEGGKLMEAGHWSEACPKIEASLKLDPGIGSSLRLAYCWEKLGRSASAWSMYNETEAMARKAGDKRADEAAKHAKRLESLLPRLVLDVAPGSQAVGVEIRRDGKVIDAAAWTSRIPIDPGLHVLEAAAPGRLPWKTSLTIEAKPGATTVRVPALEAAPAAPAAVVAPATETGGFWGAQRAAGAGIAGAGVVGVVVGSVFGSLALKKLSDAKSQGHCDPDWATCDATGLQLEQDSRKAAHASTAGLVLGGAALVTGIVVFATAPAVGGAPAPVSGARLSLAPMVGANTTGVLLRGGW
jgi:hypothetical protein